MIQLAAHLAAAGLVQYQSRAGVLKEGTFNTAAKVKSHHKTPDGSGGKGSVRSGTQNVRAGSNSPFSLAHWHAQWHTLTFRVPAGGPGRPTSRMPRALGKMVLPQVMERDLCML